MREAT
jgi:hypothetical protein